MAKKFKAYAWPDRPDLPEDEEEEIDVVGDSQSSCWGPSSPTEGATAPSPPPTSPHGTNLLYNGEYLYLHTFTIFQFHCLIGNLLKSCFEMKQILI